MTPVEEFKLFLIRHDLSLSPALDIVKYNPDILNKYSMEDIAILSNYLIPHLKPTPKQIKMKPILYNACQLAAMKKHMTLIDWIDDVLFDATKDIVSRELEHILDNTHKKIHR